MFVVFVKGCCDMFYVVVGEATSSPIHAPILAPSPSMSPNIQTPKNCCFNQTETKLYPGLCFVLEVQYDH